MNLAKESMEPAAVDEPVFVSLHTFAQRHALKYGIEMMGGFYHTQETAKHFADTEANWHRLMESFAGKEVI